MASSPPMQLHPTACRRSHLRLGRTGSHLLNHPNKRLGLPLTKVELTSLGVVMGMLMATATAGGALLAGLTMVLLSILHR